MSFYTKWSLQIQTSKFTDKLFLQNVTRGFLQFTIKLGLGYKWR